MRALVRIASLTVLCLTVASPAAAARRGDKPGKDDLQRRADQAAVRYERAVAQISKLADEVGRLQRRIGDGETKMAPLRASVTRRAVAVYTGDRGIDAFSGFTSGDDLVESARAAKLASGASARDYAVIETLGRASIEMARRRDELSTRLADQQRVADDLRGERKNVEEALAHLAKRERSLRSRLVPRASRGERVPAEARSGPIPVVTDFICPLRGPKTFTNSWGAPRPGGRRHEGTDIMSPHGTENVAVVSGTFETHYSGAGGLSIYLHGDDGHTYYYAHLSKIVGNDRRVAQGELIGLTGNSGNAGAPHTHFEFHPNGGRAVNSYSLVKAHC